MNGRDDTLSAGRGNRRGNGFFRVLLKCGGFGIALRLSRIVEWFYARFDRRAFMTLDRLPPSRWEL